MTYLQAQGLANGDIRIRAPFKESWQRDYATESHRAASPTTA
jgi:hypothetical protein